MSSSRGKKVAVPTSKKRKGVSSSSGPPNHRPLGDFLWDHRADHGPISPRWISLPAKRPRIWYCTGLYTKEFKEENDLHALNRHIHRSHSRCSDTLVPSACSPSISEKGKRALASSILMMPTFYSVCCTGKSSTFLISLPSPFSTRRSDIGRGSSPLAPMLLAQESFLTLIGQKSSQGISSMLSMRMIEKRRGTYPPQYRLAQSTDEEALEDITDDVPPQHKDPPSQPPPPSRPGFETPLGKVSTTSMSCSTTTITNFRYNILLAQDLWTNERLPSPEYPPPPSRRLFSQTLVQGNSFITQEVSLLSLKALISCSG
ncbi:hypothetical protein GOBAR_AA07129 [Gossypium barbadense]|uniref:Uncharacterized protein n=1 Tax=Gossypium barbadense TaxID=3634 RepID=A0A2P5YCZ1_GOSBA|nr:hypothetical protein GOBAR_AA07129 [Gossypium barbadense]